VDRRTRAVYERRAETWIAQRGVDAESRRALTRFARGLAKRARVADLGCGPGWFTRLLAARGRTVFALDLARPMLASARDNAPGSHALQGDLARLPFARESLHGAWAKNSYIHLPLRELPGALAELHRALRPGAVLTLSLFSVADSRRGWAQRRDPKGPFAGRLFTSLTPELARALLEGAGFRAIRALQEERLWLSATRAHTLADSARTGLRALVVGLNPSAVAAASGVPFAGANNRFWPAAVRAGWVARERDLGHALARGIGFTDFVKRVSPGASVLRRAEYARGAQRLERLVRALAPRAVVFVGLAGYRSAIDGSARPGRVRGGFAGRPAYLAPSSSGRNASLSLAALAAHFRAALR
jgi:SAM-dependent methyltransferase